MNAGQAYSKNGPPLSFIHANGYPLDVYDSLLAPLFKDYWVVGYHLRPFWPESDPEDIQDWRDFRDDYLGFLTAESGGIFPKVNEENKVIAVGHSIGAMTSLLAAIKHPSLFKALVLLEPVLLPRWYGFLMRLAAPYKVVRHLHPLIRQTLQRKTHFRNREVMFDNYRKKPRFRRIADDILMKYVSGLSHNLPDGSVDLVYKPEWEARIYETAGIADKLVWKMMGQLRCPVLVIRGEDSDTLRESVFQQLVKGLPNGHGITLSGAGHLAPLEKPIQTAEKILDFLESN